MAAPGNTITISGAFQYNTISGALPTRLIRVNKHLLRFELRILFVEFRGLLWPKVNGACFGLRLTVHHVTSKH